MTKCFPNFESEINDLKPSIVFLLGTQVGKFVLGKISDTEIQLDSTFSYKSIEISNITYIPVHHPSHILIYKRKALENYVKGIQCYLRNPVRHNG